LRDYKHLLREYRALLRENRALLRECRGFFEESFDATWLYGEYNEYPSPQRCNPRQLTATHCNNALQQSPSRARAGFFERHGGMANIMKTRSFTGKGVSGDKGKEGHVQSDEVKNW